MNKTEILLNFTWCLPQTILGLIWFLAMKQAGQIKTGYLYLGMKHSLYKNIRYGLCLGYYTFSPNIFKKVRHEYGHYRQSLMLGPLYLIAIGLPSLAWVLTYRMFGKPYSWFYTEKWADYLGGVNNSMLRVFD